MEEKKQKKEELETKPQDKKEERQTSELKLEEEKKEPMVEKQKVEKKENVSKKEKPINNNITEKTKTKKKGKLGLLLGGGIIILAIILGLVYYFTIYTRPEQILKRVVGGTIDQSYTNYFKQKNATTKKTAIEIGAEVKPSEELENNLVLDLINKTKIGVEVQADNEEKQFLVNLNSQYDKQDLLNIQMVSNLEDKQTYVNLKNIIDKYLKIEVNDEFYTAFNELLEAQKMTPEQKRAGQKAGNIIKNEFINIIKSEYCSTKKGQITVDNKKVNTTKNTIKMTANQLRNELLKIAKKLRKNKEFLDCYENREEMIESLDTMIDYLEELDSEEIMIEFSIYTKGMMNEIAKVALKLDNQDLEESMIIACSKIDKENYELEILQDEEKLVTGTIALENISDTEATAQVKLKVQDFGTIKLTMKASQKYNEEIDKVKIENSIASFNELTEKEQQTMMENLQKSKLYEIIEQFAGASLPISGTNDLSGKEEENDNKGTELTSSKQILSYDGNYKITINTPKDYESDFISNRTCYLDKDDIEIKISTQYGNQNDYYEELKQSKQYAEEQSDYQNVTITDKQEINVKGRTFYQATLSYDYVGDFNYHKTTKYFWSELADDTIIEVAVDYPEQVTESELNQILDLKIEQ